jgi:hypothetical protein
VTRALAALFAVLALPAAATDVSVFGFALGSPLTLARCPAEPATRISPFPQRTCLRTGAARADALPQETAAIALSEADTPGWLRNGILVAFIDHGTLAGLRFATRGAQAQDAALAALTEKYGAPATSGVEVVQTLGGATFQSHVVTWTAGQVSVTFYGTFGRVDIGQVTIDLPPAQAARRAALAAGGRKL